MEITEVRVFLKEGADKKLRAYATITVDNAFVIRNVKIIQGTKGLFVAMPSRKLKESCPRCHHKNDFKSKFCNFCGAGLPFDEKKYQDKEARMSEHRDIAHPITQECREYIQKKVLEAYDLEQKNPTAKEDVPPAPPVREEVPAPPPSRPTPPRPTPPPSRPAPVDEGRLAGPAAVFETDFDEDGDIDL